MTNRIELKCDLYYAVDEHRYYCSETPIDLENLPVPKAVLAGDVRTYTDSSIEVGKYYYVCVGSVKSGVEKFSEVLFIRAAKEVPWSNVSALLHFNNSTYDEKNQIPWESYSPQYGIGKWGMCAKFSANTQNTIKSGNLPSFDFEDKDFRIQMQLKINRKSGINEWMGILGKNEEDDTRAFVLFLMNNSSQLVFQIKDKATKTLYSISSNIELPISQFTYIEISRVGNNLYMIIENQIVGQVALPSGMMVYQNNYGISLGRIYYIDPKYPLDGYIDELRITKGEGVDINNLIVPIYEFPNS